MAPKSEGRVPPLGALVAERYRLLRLVGEGAMGAIFEAERLGDHRRVAVKMLYRDLTPVMSGGGVLARFLREAQVSSSITHENVVPVVDGGVDITHATAFLVMDLL